MDVSLTVKGLCELARMYEADAEALKEIAMKAGGEWFTDWDKNRVKARRCAEQAEALLGDFNMLPLDVQQIYIPF